MITNKCNFNVKQQNHKNLDKHAADYKTMRVVGTHLSKYTNKDVMSNCSRLISWITQIVTISSVKYNTNSVKLTYKPWVSNIYNKYQLLQI